MRLFPDFDDNLRQAFRQETELFFDSILREDRSVLDLLRADYTFVNERLAKHYGIPHVYGSRFRRVDLGRGQRARRPAAPGQHPHGDLVRDPDLAGGARQMGARQPARRAAAAAAARRAGAEGQHGRRPPLRPRAAGRAPQERDLRELPQPDGSRLACRSRRFDAVGRRRTSRTACRSMRRRAFPTAAGSTDVDGLEAALLRRPELFVGDVHREAPDLRVGPRRRVLRCAGRPRDRARRAGGRFRFSSIVLGVVKSAPFQMRMSR